MDQLERLVAIEAIKNVKARYWYCMDTKDWPGLREVFTDDAVFDMRAERDLALGTSMDGLPPAPAAAEAGDPLVIVGAEVIASFIRSAVESWTTVHHGHAPPKVSINNHSAIEAPPAHPLRLRPPTIERIGQTRASRTKVGRIR